MSIDDARLWEMVEETARAVTDDDSGRFEEKAFVDALRQRLGEDDLKEHVRAAALDRLARTLATGFVRSRSPKPGKPEGMFDPSAVLKLGRGLRVWMEKATAYDLILWGRLSSQNVTKVVAADASRQEYVSDRIEAFLDHPGWLLGRLERTVFGYEETTEPPDCSDFAEADDWDEDES